MICQTTTIINKLGLHARASAKLVQLASSYQSDIRLGRNGQKVNGKSIMGIMMLAASKGTEIEVCADGDDEQEALDSLMQLIRNRFEEED